MTKLRFMYLLLVSAVVNANLASLCRSAVAPSLSSFSDGGYLQTLAATPAPQESQSASAGEVVSEEPASQPQNDITLHQMWARQNLTPPAEASLQVTTVTVVRTVTVELASRTEVIWSPLQQTLTFINPTLVFETSIVTASQPQDIAARDAANAIASDQAAIPEISSADLYYHEGAQLSPHPAPVRRQTLASVNRVSTVTVEITTTIVASGTIVRTVTIFNPVFVSITQTPTLTTTIFTTATLPLENAVSSVPAVVPSPLASQKAISSDDAQQTASFTTPDPPSSTEPTLAASEPQQPSVASSTLGVPESTRVRSLSDTSRSISASSLILPSSSTPATKEGTSVRAGPVTSSGPPLRSTSATAAPPLTETLLPPTERISRPCLGPEAIAGIAVGATFALTALILLFLCIRRQRSKRRRHLQLNEGDRHMTTATAGNAIMYRATSHPLTYDGPCQSPQTEGCSSKNSEEEQVRIVIKPITKNRSMSSVLSALPKVWPRPPGYTGKAFSFSAGGSGETTPREPTGWSVESEYGSSGNQDASRSGGPGEAAAWRGPVAARPIADGRCETGRIR
ncbi:hypothetical protein CSAL01_07454 [Colletotrichum salicis]|uniref:Uncharacterized protein n=1 Tax=Colletotrichum salicis TaxID=1209931 RepID=A0A135UAS7_9PEZI|nr:hypothetical protein CSAL01_07454 [Colletotrichum salicis]